MSEKSQKATRPFVSATFATRSAGSAPGREQAVASRTVRRNTIFFMVMLSGFKSLYSVVSYFSFLAVNSAPAVQFDVR
jgi:hypothetical protein